MSNLTKYFVRCGFFSLEFLHEILAKFSYADCDKADKSHFVYKAGSWTNFKIKQNAIEMKNIIRLYPLLVGNMAPEDDEVWDLLISSIKIKLLKWYYPHHILLVRHKFLRRRLRNFLRITCKLYQKQHLSQKLIF